MYLTEICLQDEAAARLLPYNPYNWHQRVWSFFPGRSERDFLYRVDYTARGLRLLILSEHAPVTPMDFDSSAFRCREIPESFFTHSLYHFQIRVNATRRVKVDARTGKRVEKGMRVPITETEELLNWLKRKGEQGGFSLPYLEGEENSPSCYLNVIPEKQLVFQKKGCALAHHASVQFAGVLRVENPDVFRQTFKCGIGSAKSFGFGLLMLQPLN